MTVLQVGKKFQPVNVDLVGKIHFGYIISGKQDLTLQLFFYCPKIVNAKHLKGVIFLVLLFHYYCCFLV